MDSSFYIRIVNFEKYKGRKDVTHNSWFRCSNRILEDHEFFTFTHEEILVWVYLLALSSQKNTMNVLVSHQHAHQVCRLSEDAVNSAVEKLIHIKCIEKIRTRTSRGRYVGGTRTCATNKQTNKHSEKPAARTRLDKQVLKEEQEQAFEKFWTTYPKRDGKSKALRVFTRFVTVPIETVSVIQAAANYAQSTLGRDPKFIKLPTTFLQDRYWEEWVSAEKLAQQNIGYDAASGMDVNL